jgi:hypothetical protein
MKRQVLCCMYHYSVLVFAQEDSQSALSELGLFGMLVAAVLVAGLERCHLAKMSTLRSRICCPWLCMQKSSHKPGRNCCQPYGGSSTASGACSSGLHFLG